MLFSCAYCVCWSMAIVIMRGLSYLCCMAGLSVIVSDQEVDVFEMAYTTLLHFAVTLNLILILIL